jgi:hypothetical protein
MPPGATRRLGEGEYVHLATQATVRRLAETLWEVRDQREKVLGVYQTKRLALRSLDEQPATPTENRPAYLAAVLAQVVPPKPGHAYRVVEVPTELLDGTIGDLDGDGHGASLPGERDGR